MGGKSMKKMALLVSSLRPRFSTVEVEKKKKKTGRKIKPGKSQSDSVCLGQLIQPRIHRFHLLPNQDARSFQFRFFDRRKKREERGETRHRSEEAFSANRITLARRISLFKHNGCLFVNLSRLSSSRFYERNKSDLSDLDQNKIWKQIDAERQVKLLRTIKNIRSFYYFQLIVLFEKFGSKFSLTRRYEERFISN